MESYNKNVSAQVIAESGRIATDVGRFLTAKSRNRKEIKGKRQRKAQKETRN